MFNRDKEPRIERQANQELVDYDAFLKHVSIMDHLPLTWKEQQEYAKKLQRQIKIQNWLFIIEGLIILGILWLVAPQVIEHLF